MAQTYTCDWCGDEIVSDGVRGLAYLSTHGLHTDTRFVSRPMRHFHAGAHDDDDSCFLRAFSVLEEHLATNSPQPRVVKQRQETDRDRQRVAREGWTGLDRNVKMGRILSALAGDGLTRGEIVERIERAQPGISVYDSDVLPLLNEMLGTGEAEREKEPRGPNCSITARGGYRWRWRRRVSNMSPELQDLEQRLKGM
jgi:hypothetical protein